LSDSLLILNTGNEISVIKQNVLGQETFRYTGKILASYPNAIVIEAFFNRPDLPFHGITMVKGDRFIEIYFRQRWFNIFEMHDRIDDHLKGWYCNVTKPACITPQQISYIDLALDLLVFPNGNQLVLDEDEFLELSLDEDTRQDARVAINELKDLAATQKLSPLNRQNWV
jgi:uncharacterized protein